MGLGWLQVLIFNRRVMRLRPELRVSFMTAFLFPVYRAVMMFVRVLALLHNVLHFALTPKKPTLEHMQDVGNVPPCPPIPDLTCLEAPEDAFYGCHPDVDWDTVWLPQRQATTAFPPMPNTLVWVGGDGAQRLARVTKTASVADDTLTVHYLDTNTTGHTVSLQQVIRWRKRRS